MRTPSQGNSPGVRLRPYAAADRIAVAAIYRQAIRHLGRQHYTRDQVRAWAGHADDESTFSRWLDDASTTVAIDPELGVVGFGGIDAHGRITSVFVSPSVMRRGVASTILDALLQQARASGFEQLTTEASEFSRPLFERFGFRVTGIEKLVFRGVDFSRYTMRADLASPGNGMSD